LAVGYEEQPDGADGAIGAVLSKKEVKVGTDKAEERGKK